MDRFLHRLIGILFTGLCLVDFVGCHHGIEPPVPGIDTTSHNVLWRTYIIGEQGPYGPSFAEGVAIVNDTSVYVVGDFFPRDSIGHIDTTNYNATNYNLAKWDGSGWTYDRVLYDISGQGWYAEFYSIVAFNRNDIWVASDLPMHWNGNLWEQYSFPRDVFHSWIYAMWGSSSTDVYILGINGQLAHFGGTSFSKVPTGVSSRFTDIYGSGSQVYVSSYYYDNLIRPSGVFSYSNGSFQFLFPPASDSSDFQALREAFGVWLSPRGILWATGADRVFRPYLSHQPMPGANPNQYLLYCLRGLSDSDVWAGGDAGTVLHYNGATWKQYDELKAEVNRVQYRRVAVKGRLVVLVGFILSLDQAVVTIGTRG